MNYRKWTAEELEWLKENYPTKSDHYCRTHLHTSYKMLWQTAEELGLVKVKPTDFEKNKEVQVIKCSKKTAHYDEGARGYCMDCPHYSKGAICSKTGKEIGALWQKKCYSGEALPPQVQTQKKSNTMEKTKKCIKCGEELPISAFGKHTKTKDGLQSWCKKCIRVYAKAAKQSIKENVEKEEVVIASEEKVVETPVAQKNPQVEAVRALGKIYSPEEVETWLELNNSYKMFLKYFEA